MKRLLTRIFQVVAAAVFIVIALPLLWIIEPIWRIRLGSLIEDRIGHLAVPTGDISPIGTA